MRRALTILDLVVLVLCIGLIAWMGTGQVAKMRSAVREELALQNIRLIGRACLFYRRAAQDFPDDLTKLGGPTSDPDYVPEAFAQPLPVKQGYEYRYQRLGRDAFQLVANPVQHGKMGRRHYMTDQSLIVHATLEEREATLMDPVQR